MAVRSVARPRLGPAMGVASDWARRSRSIVPATLGIVLAIALVPGRATAHGVTTSRFDAPVPLWLLLVGAGATVAATALLVAVGDRRHRAGTAERRGRTWRLFSVSAAALDRVRSLLGVGFLLVFVTVLLAGAVGRQTAAGNLATVVTWPLWFHGVALVAILLGDPWPTLSPWRTIYRGLVRLEGGAVAVLGSTNDDGRRTPRGVAGAVALLGFLALLGVVENLTVIPRSPRLTAAVVGSLALAMVLGGVLAGPTWFDRADPLGVLYRLFGRASPVTIESSTAESATTDSARAKSATADERAVVLRPPWRGCERPVANGWLAAFAVAMVYTVSFDGARELRAFQTALFAVRDALGTGPGTSVLLYVAGLAGFLAVFALACWLVEYLGSADHRRWRGAALAFAPTLVPIAAAYEVAHVYPYVATNLGQLPVLVLEPFGVAVAPVEPLAWLSLPAFWASQVLLIVAGHVVAVIAAHRVASGRFETPQAARRGHLPLVLVMVGYTALSLWIVSTPVVS